MTATAAVRAGPAAAGSPRPPRRRSWWACRCSVAAGPGAAGPSLGAAPARQRPRRCPELDRRHLPQPDHD